MRVVNESQSLGLFVEHSVTVSAGEKPRERSGLWFKLSAAQTNTFRALLTLAAVADVVDARSTY